VFKDVKLFTLVLIRAVSGILYLFLNIIYSKVKYLPLISRLRLIFNILIIYSRQESCLRVPLFLTRIFSLTYYYYIIPL
jgi:hypothetical protein